MKPVSEFLLGTSDPPPVEVIRAAGQAPLVLICEHGGRAVPETLAGHKPAADDMARHIAFDIGAAAVAQGLAVRLDAALALQLYSRLVIDCNRPRHAADLAPAVSDGTRIPFNEALDANGLSARWHAIHQPFHRAIEQLLDQRRGVTLIAIHSFTPKLRDQPPRPMMAGLLARQDMTLARTLKLAMVAHGAKLGIAFPDDAILFNAPYQIEDISDYTIPIHGETRGLPHLLLEIRNDLIADPNGVGLWTDLLAKVLSVALPQSQDK